jgi:hypothetical protein
VLFVHEVHRVIGSREEEFEAAFREGWMPALGQGDDARLLWYCSHAHGTGPAYNVVTLTAVRDGAAWERLATRMQRGDLTDWAAGTDELRHGVAAKVLVPVAWSPLQEVDLGDVPTRPAEHAPSMYLEDTGWPSAPLDDYIRFWGESYHRPMQSRPRGARLLEVEASFQPAFGAGRRREAVLWQKILNHDGLLALLTHETAPEHKAPGTFMHEALAYRDQWESKLLRTSRWSPRW